MFLYCFFSQLISIDHDNAIAFSTVVRGGNRRGRGTKAIKLSIDAIPSVHAFQLQSTSSTANQRIHSTGHNMEWMRWNDININVWTFLSFLPSAHHKNKVFKVIVVPFRNMMTFVRAHFFVSLLSISKKAFEFEIPDIKYVWQKLEETFLQIVVSRCP